MIPFIPPAGLSSGVFQTILGSQMTGDTTIEDRRVHKIPLGGKNLLLCLELPAKSEKQPLVVMIHGMGGCSESAYMRRIATRLGKRGLGVFMVNQRGSGPGMGLSNSLWNGGSSGDLACVVEYLTRVFPARPVLLIGFSLSGNILLKYLGEGRAIPSTVHAALSVNPPVDLKAAALAISNGRWSRTFNRYYMGLINRQVRAIRQCFPDAFVPQGEPSTIYDFDVAYTARVGGFRNVDDYYEKCSAAHLLDRIVVPTTVLCSRNDPFVPFDIFQSLKMSLCVVGEFPEGGGHMGYIANKKLPTGDRRWMDYFVCEWVADACRIEEGAPGGAALASAEPGAK